MTEAELLNEIERRDEIIGAHAAVEREYREQIRDLRHQLAWLALSLADATRDDRPTIDAA